MATRSSNPAGELLSALMASGDAVKYLLERADHRDLNIKHLALTALREWKLVKEFIVMALLESGMPRATVVISYGATDRPAIFLRFRKDKGSWRLSKAATKEKRGGRPWAWEIVVGLIGIKHFIRRRKRLIVEEETIYPAQVKKFNPLLYQATKATNIPQIGKGGVVIRCKRS